MEIQKPSDCEKVPANIPVQKETKRVLTLKIEIDTQTFKERFRKFQFQEKTNIRNRMFFQHAYESAGHKLKYHYQEYLYFN